MITFHVGTRPLSIAQRADIGAMTGPVADGTVRLSGTAGAHAEITRVARSDDGLYVLARVSDAAGDAFDAVDGHAWVCDTFGASQAHRTVPGLWLLSYPADQPAPEPAASTGVRDLVAAVVAGVFLAVWVVASVLTLAGVARPCEHEDSPSCVWVGPVQGNGAGAWLVVNGADRDAAPLLVVDPRTW